MGAGRSGGGASVTLAAGALEVGPSSGSATLSRHPSAARTRSSEAQEVFAAGGTPGRRAEMAGESGIYRTSLLRPSSNGPPFDRSRLAALSRAEPKK
jgi:hypothetical protein